MKLAKICDSFTGSRYETPQAEINSKLDDLNRKIIQTKDILKATESEVTKYLFSVNTLEESDLSAIQIYKWFIVKEIALYKALNTLRASDSMLIGLFWAPTSEVNNIFSKINDIKEDRNIIGPQMWKRENHRILPPTYFKLNEFTEPFQTITNTYGVPNYKEVNPSVFAIVTFPFLFAVMFGDLGHGSLVLGFSLCLIFMRDYIQTTALSAILPLRYMLLLMGIMATFVGF